jgi:hypothetical protein
MTHRLSASKSDPSQRPEQQSLWNPALSMSALTVKTMRLLTERWVEALVDTDSRAEPGPRGGEAVLRVPLPPETHQVTDS